MPRELVATLDNTLSIVDRLSKESVLLTYRTPTTDERVGYQKGLMIRKGNRIVSRIPETQLKYGSAILTGIRPGDFVAEGLPLSSTPGEEGYRDDWKELVEATAGDLLLILGREVFEGVQDLAPQIAAGLALVDDEEEGDEAAPLA